jgi:hypothetical protein
MIRLFVRALAVLVPLSLLVAPVTQASSQASLADVRQATAKFHDVVAAEHANYHRLLPCFDLPGTGGMGQHYVNTDLLDGAVTPGQPEAMVYEVDGDRLELVAVEYIIPLSAWQSAAKPTLFGRDFTRIDSLGLWALHAWIWRPNPNGIFQNYNPSVRMCPGH